MFSLKVRIIKIQIYGFKQQIAQKILIIIQQFLVHFREKHFLSLSTLILDSVSCIQFWFSDLAKVAVDAGLALISSDNWPLGEFFHENSWFIVILYNISSTFVIFTSQIKNENSYCGDLKWYFFSVFIIYRYHKVNVFVLELEYIPLTIFYRDIMSDQFGSKQIQVKLDEVFFKW